MYVKLLKSKLHRARVTSTVLDYPGSMAVDADLMKETGLKPYESVFIADINNGNRLETYVIEAEAGSGKIEILGAAARLIDPGDIIIVFSFGFYGPDEIEGHKPSVIALDENNRIIKRVS